jgi:hypothetical protein
MDDYFKNRFLDLIETIYDMEATEGRSGTEAANIMQEIVLENGYADEFLTMSRDVTKVLAHAMYLFGGAESVAIFFSTIITEVAMEISEFDENP